MVDSTWRGDKLRNYLNEIPAMYLPAYGYNLYCKDLAVSPITGGDGNIEYLARFNYTKEPHTVPIPDAKEIYKIVFGANQ